MYDNRSEEFLTNDLPPLSYLICLNFRVVLCVLLPLFQEEEEEEEDDDSRPPGVYRRLIFLKNEGVVQTEVSGNVELRSHGYFSGKGNAGSISGTAREGRTRGIDRLYTVSDYQTGSINIIIARGI